jgi:hypothetical protein
MTRETVQSAPESRTTGSAHWASSSSYRTGGRGGPRCHGQVGACANDGDRPWDVRCGEDATYTNATFRTASRHVVGIS